MRVVSAPLLDCILGTLKQFQAEGAHILLPNLDKVIKGKNEKVVTISLTFAEWLHAGREKLVRLMFKYPEDPHVTRWYQLATQITALIPLNLIITWAYRGDVFDQSKPHIFSANGHAYHLDTALEYFSRFSQNPSYKIVDGCLPLLCPQDVTVFQDFFRKNNAHIGKSLQNIEMITWQNTVIEILRKTQLPIAEINDYCNAHRRSLSDNLKIAFATFLSEAAIINKEINLLTKSEMMHDAASTLLSAINDQEKTTSSSWAQPLQVFIEQLKTAKNKVLEEVELLRCLQANGFRITMPPENKTASHLSIPRLPFFSAALIAEPPSLHIPPGGRFLLNETIRNRLTKLLAEIAQYSHTKTEILDGAQQLATQLADFSPEIAEGRVYYQGLEDLEKYVQQALAMPNNPIFSALNSHVKKYYEVTAKILSDIRADLTIAVATMVESAVALRSSV